MHTPLIYLFIVVACLGCDTSDPAPSVVIHTEDIDHYWQAYDSIVSSQDTAEQLRYLRELYLEPGSPGLSRLIKERNYTEEEYLKNMLAYPNFWASIRDATQNTDELTTTITGAIDLIQKLYSNHKPAEIYFAIGAFRSGGTAVDSLVLIGAESSLADNTTELGDFSAEQQKWMIPLYAKNPRSGLMGLIAHEYVHTQQRPIPEYLYGQSLYEGIAEFISCLATGEEPDQAVKYGQTKPDSIAMIFAREMFNEFNRRKWLWSNAPNRFGQRDLGYYVGYTISESLYNETLDKSNLIEELTELDYSDTSRVEAMIDASGFLPAPVAELRSEYEANRPRVIDVERSGQNFTITFSQPMNVRTRNFEFGPGGADKSLRIASVIGYAPDGKHFSFTVEGFPAGEYRELLLGPRFFGAEYGAALQPFLIEVN